jgi:YHS domain-containing protein
MKVRLFSLCAALAALGLAVSADAPKADPKAMEALQELSEFIGQWKTNGEDSKKAIWKETWEFGWKFGKDGDTYILVKVADSKFLTGAEVRYDAAKKGYAVKLTDKAGKEQAFAGKLTNGKLALERRDDKTGDVHKFVVNTAANGIRLIAQYDVQTGGKGLASTMYKAAGNKEGESFAGGGKKNVCIVTEGLGTIQVSYMGKTYYVCCSGCKEEFDANPKKYVDAKKK